jgi:hypothetical protein
MRRLVVAAALVGLALPATASAADSVTLLVHGTVTFQAPSSKCPGGKASTHVTVLSTGLSAAATACSGPVSPCGDECLQSVVKYTFSLRGGKVVVSLQQTQYGDPTSAIAAVTATGTVTKATKSYAGLNGASAAGGGTLMANPDGTATANLALSILAPPATGLSPHLAPTAMSEIVTLDGPLTFGDVSNKCSNGVVSATGTLLPAGETGNIEWCVMDATSCGTLCTDATIRFDAHFDSGNFRAVVTAHILTDGAGAVTGETWIGSVKRGSGVFDPLVDRPFIGGGAIVGSDAHLAWAALA